MTFSDAEEDQPSSLQNRERTSENIANSQPGSSNDVGAEGVDEAGPQQSCPASEISELNSNTSSLTAPSMSLTNGSVTDDKFEQSTESVPVEEEVITGINNMPLLNISGNAEGPELSSSNEPSTQLHGGPVNVNASEGTASDNAGACFNGAAGASSSNAAVSDSAENTDLEAEKIKEKLQQIQGYIQQTTNAMQSLESEENMDNIGKYDTLVKVMRDLKSSESKLIAHLIVLKEKSSNQTCSQDSLSDQFEVLYNSLQVHENECADVLNKSLLTVQGSESRAKSGNQPKESGSESIGVVGSFNGDSSQPSLHDRLNHHQHEQEILSARLRESLLRRQELMTRYQATRERLNNLKRKRFGIALDERKLLQSAGAPATPYEDPIPGADAWTIEQLESAVQDFIALRDKVDRVHQAYMERLEAVEEGDTDTPIELNSKIVQVLSKRVQIQNALTQMRDILVVKRDGMVEDEENVDSNLFNPEDNNHFVEHSPIAEAASEIMSVRGEFSRLVPSEGARTAQESDEDLVNASVAEGAQALSEEVQELQAKQHHLQSLKNQLNAMKRLLLVTQDASGASHNQTVHSGTQNISQEETIALPNWLQEHSSENSGNLINDTVVSLSGAVVHLSETERRDPLVVSKYLQLAQAKERLAKMEAIMALISEAGDKGVPLDEVLSPEDMDILTQARDEEDITIVSPIMNPNDIYLLDGLRSRETGSQGQPIQKEIKPNHQHNRNSNQVNESHNGLASSSSDWEREKEKEISAMQFQLNKKIPGIPSVNDGSRVEREKGAVKKQARSLFCEGGNDPRVSELVTLQEELKEKKNALEALMKKMGKSSSFTLDNISDNISENLSDCNSETVERPTASWGNHQRRYFSDVYHSEEDIQAINEEAPIFNTISSMETTPHTQQRAEGQTASGFQQSATQKNRNRLNLPGVKAQINSGNSQFSVNNLNGSNPKSVRPKHNLRGSSLPVGSWDNVPSSNNNILNLDPNTKVQNTVSAALSQLSQVQETINSLYEELRNSEQDAHRTTIPLNAFENTAIRPSLLPQQQPYATGSPNLNINYPVVQPPISSQVRGETGTTSHLIAGLQQCFSQLYLHSLEIQSLNKHLQVLDQKEKSSPSHRREFYDNQRSEAPPGITSNGVQTHGRSAGPDLKPNFLLPNFNHYDDSKQESHMHRPFPNRNESTEDMVTNAAPHHQRNAASHHQRNEGNLLEVSNPLYERISNNRSSSWSMPCPTDPSISKKNFFTPFNDRVLNDERTTKDHCLLNASGGFPMDSEGIIDNIPWAWGTESSQMHSQQSTDILNNQVLPGTRANNYWDNFRSYSHQNPLSTAAKCNTGERHPTTSSSTPISQPLNTNSRLRSAGFENRQYNLTSGSNNSINKASDKNSSNTRSQNKGARSKYPHQTNSRRSTLSDSHLYNHVSPSSEQRLHNDARKRNNRQNYGASNEPHFFNHDESSRSYGFVTPDIENHESSERDRSLRNQRLRNTDENHHPNTEQYSRLLNLERRSTTSQEDLTNISEAYSQVVREAESLMQKHSHQPQFLLQLFHHASQITSNTDQHVALELLRELSNQRHQSNISNNRWNSNSSVTQSDNLSSGVSATVTGRNNYRNDSRFPSKNSHPVHGISGSDTSESGMSSDEDERERKENIRQLMMMKNLAPPVSVDGTSPTNRNNPQNYASAPKLPTMLPGIPEPSIIPHNLMPLSATSKVLAGKEVSNLTCDFAANERSKSENQTYGERFHRLKGDTDNSVRNYHPNYCSEVSSRALQNSYDVSQRNDEESRLLDGGLNLSRKRKSPRREIHVDGKSNFVLKNRQKNLNFKHPGSSQPIQQGSAGFESIVSAALREVLRVFEWPENNISSNGQVLETLHRSIMAQVELQSKTLGFSSSFVSLVESQLKATLQGFQGKRISHVRQELAATVTQVLIHQYCSLLVTQENSADYIQPQTPDSNYAEFHPPSNNTEVDDSFMPVASRHLNNQSCLNSLFGQSEGVVKQQKQAKPLWSYTPNITGECNQLNREDKMQVNKSIMTQVRDEAKSNPINLSRGKGGAIAKTTTTSNPSSNDNFNVRSNAMGGSSPTSDAPYTETWMVSRGASSMHTEGNLNNSSSHDSYNCGQRGRSGRESVDAAEMLELEHNDTEADQGDHSRAKEFHNSLLPVHDLAEADQSQDALDGECADSSVEDETQEAAMSSFCQLTPQNQDSPIRLMTRKNMGPTSGLDEVPTRLLSGPDGASPPLGSTVINGRHPPEGLASSNESRNRPGGHSSNSATSQFSPPQSNSPQFDGRHPPDGQNQAGQQQQTFHSSDSAGSMG